MEGLSIFSSTRYPLPEKPRQKRAVIQDMVRPLKHWLLRHRYVSSKDTVVIYHLGLKDLPVLLEWHVSYIFHLIILAYAYVSLITFLCLSQ